MYKSQERGSCLIISGGDAAVVFHSVKEPLDPVTVLVEILVDEAGLLCVGAGGDHHLSAQLSNGFGKGAAVVAFVGHHRPGHVLCQQRLGLFVVRLLPRGENEPAGVAQGIAAGMDLG